MWTIVAMAVLFKGTLSFGDWSMWTIVVMAVLFKGTLSFGDCFKQSSETVMLSSSLQT